MKFSIGNALNEGVGLLSLHMKTIVPIGLVTYVFPMTVGVIALFYATGIDMSDSSAAAADGGFWSAFGLYMLLSMLASVLSLSMITEVVVLGAARKPFNFGESLGRAFKNLFPLIIVYILVTLMFTLGTILLIIPGIIIFLALSVAFTAYAAEPGTGIFGAMKRSRELTKGHRWAILAIVLIVGIALAVISGFITMPVRFIGASLPSPINIGISTLINSITSVVGVVFNVAIYITLRRSKDKLVPDTVAEVFA